MVDELVPIIKRINKKGVSVLLVEQNIPLALRLAEKGYALQVGKVVSGRRYWNVQVFRSRKKAYLGG